MMHSIAILLTVHNRKELTLECIKQIYAQDYDNERYKVEVYLTDDGSTDGTSEAIEQNYPDVNIIKGDGSLFWNRGMHLAWETACKRKDYDYYLWLNDDTKLYADCLSKLLFSSSSHNDNCIVVGSTCWRSDVTKLSYGGYNNRKRILSVDTEMKCETMNGNIVLVPNYVFKKVGNLDYAFHHSGGDFDYGYRATKAGIEIYVAKGFCGECDRHTKMAKCFDANMSLKQRWKAYNFNHSTEDSFLAYRRHHGLLLAIVRISSGFIHMLFPGVYDKIFGNKNL